jgi:carbonic anhydrase/acetyltransferase-like protein (isoleucine patch superfamily)
MNAVIMDEVQLGDESIVGALSFVKAQSIISPRSVLAGNPAKIINSVTDEMLEWKIKGTALYQSLPAQLFATLKACEPLQDASLQKKFDGDAAYKTWKQNQE